MARLQGDLNFVPIVQPYVGAPIEEYKQTMDVLEKKYQDNLSNYNKLQIMAKNTPVQEGDREYRDAAFARLQETIESNLEAGNYEDADAIISQAARELATDQNFNTAAKNYEKYQRAQEDVRKLKMEGKQAFTLYDMTSNTSPVDEEGNILEINPVIEQAGDKRKEMEAIFDDMKGDIQALALSGVKGYDLLLQSGSIGGITDTKVKTLAKQSIESYKGTVSGDQLVRQMKSQGATDTEINDYIFKELKSVGAERTYRTEDIRYMTNEEELLKAKAAAKRAEEAFNPASPTVTSQGEALSLTPKTVNTIKTRTNDLKTRNQQLLEEINNSGIVLNDQGRIASVPDGMPLSVAQMKLDEFYNNHTEIVNNEATLSSVLKGVDSDENLQLKLTSIYSKVPKSISTNLGIESPDQFKNYVANLGPEYINKPIKEKMKDLGVEYTQNVQGTAPNSEQQGAATKFINSVDAAYDIYTSKEKEVLEVANMAVDYMVFEGSESGMKGGQSTSSIDNTNKLLSENALGRGDFVLATNPAEQVNLKYALENYGVTDIDDGKVTLIPKETKVYVTSGVLGGKPFYQMDLYGIDNTKQKRLMKIASIPVTTKVTTEISNQMIRSGNDLISEGIQYGLPNKIEQGIQMKANATFLPKLSSLGLYERDTTIFNSQNILGVNYIINKTKETSPDGQQIFTIMPQGITEIEMPDGSTRKLQPQTAVGLSGLAIKFQNIQEELFRQQ